jgi:kinetochore protein Nuf2
MAFNPRMSIIPPAQSTQRSVRKKEEEADAFMKLPDKEIVGCITDIGIPFSVADLQKPNPLQVQMIFEWFAELLLNVTRESVEPAMRAAAEDRCGEYTGGEGGGILMPADTRNLLGFYVSLRRLMMECRITDFGFNDLYKPTYDRLVKIFSNLINFVRFRESQTSVIDEHFNKAETTKARIEQLYTDNQDMEARLEEMQQNRQAMEALVQEKTQRNEELKRRLLELRRNQERVAARLEDAKAKKVELTSRLEENTAVKLAMKQESAKLRPYVLQSPTALQANLTDLSNTLGNDKAHIDSLERRARALQTSADSFTVVSTDVAGCIKLLDEIAAELAKEEDENARKTKQKDALTERGADVKEVERAELMLQKQLAKWNERTERLREASGARAAEAKDKMEELKAVHRKLNEERAQKGTDIEKRRIRIEQTEKKVSFHLRR